MAFVSITVDQNEFQTMAQKEYMGIEKWKVRIIWENKYLKRAHGSTSYFPYKWLITKNISLISLILNKKKIEKKIWFFLLHFFEFAKNIISKIPELVS